MILHRDCLSCSSIAAGMIQYFINRGGRGLSASRRRQLRAVVMLVRGWVLRSQQSPSMLRSDSRRMSRDIIDQYN